MLSCDKSTITDKPKHLTSTPRPDNIGKPWFTASDQNQPQKHMATFTFMCIFCKQAHLLSLAHAPHNIECAGLVQLQDSRDDQRVHAKYLSFTMVRQLPPDIQLQFGI